MKNPKLKFILLPFVVLIWGIISFKIYFLFTDNETADIIPIEFKVKDTDLTPVDTIVLKLNYQDPFFGGETRIIESKQKTKTPKAIKEANIIIWPAIKYYGCIRNHNKERWIAQIRINDVNISINDGDTYGNIKLLTVTRDSIIVLYRQQSKAIKLIQ